MSCFGKKSKPIMSYFGKKSKSIISRFGKKSKSKEFFNPRLLAE